MRCSWLLHLPGIDRQQLSGSLSVPAKNAYQDTGGIVARNPSGRTAYKVMQLLVHPLPKASRVLKRLDGNYGNNHSNDGLLQDH